MIISEMQDKLAKWSTEEKTRKFDRLLRLIADKEWLTEAAHITLESTGSLLLQTILNRLPSFKLKGLH